MKKDLLIFDGRCGFCTRSVEAIARLDRHGRLTILAWQQPGALERTGLEPHEVRSAAWLLQDGHRYRGAAAINRAVSTATGCSLPWLIYRLPGVRQFEDFVYAWIAANRRLLRGVTPLCKRPGVTCEP